MLEVGRKQRASNKNSTEYDNRAVFSYASVKVSTPQVHIKEARKTKEKPRYPHGCWGSFLLPKPRKTDLVFYRK